MCSSDLYDGTDLVWQAGGGGGGVAWGAITGTVTDQTDLVTYVTGLGYITGVAWGSITGTLADQTDLQSAIDAKIDDAPSDGVAYGRKDAAWEPVLQPMIVTNAGSNPYTLVAGDANNIVLVGSGSAVTVPQDSTYSFPIGTKIIICSPNGGETIVPEATGGGGNIPSINQSQTSVSVGYGKTLVKVGNDDWYAF